MSDLKAEFEAAVDFVKNGSPSGDSSNEQKLEMYALFKQATEGDVSGKKPGMFDMVGQAKYKAWEKRKGMSSDAAMQQYIDIVNSFR